MDDLFNRGYRIFLHETPASQIEITLGQCEGTTREIKMGHDLPKLILAGEFTHDDPDTNFRRSEIIKADFEHEDPDTTIWRIYDEAYPNSGGLPDISYMDDREDVVRYD